MDKDPKPEDKPGFDELGTINPSEKKEQTDDVLQSPDQPSTIEREKEALKVRAEFVLGGSLSGNRPNSDQIQKIQRRIAIERSLRSGTLSLPNSLLSGFNLKGFAESFKNLCILLKKARSEGDENFILEKMVKLISIAKGETSDEDEVIYIEMIILSVSEHIMDNGERFGTKKLELLNRLNQTATRANGPTSSSN